jgi:hypothetical protein
METRSFSKHQGNRRDCEECIAGYPTLCKCGGLIHAQYDVKEEKGKFVNLGPFANCDKCGTNFLKANQSLRRKGRAHHNSRFNKSNESTRRSNS